MIPHAIRLRHPWLEAPPTQPGRNAYRRSFNRPTGLDPWETVTLEIDRTVYRGQATFNGQPLGVLEPGELFAANITPLLEPTNELVVEIDPQTNPFGPHSYPPSHSAYIVDPHEPLGSPIGDVRLVIRSPSPNELK